MADLEKITLGQEGKFKPNLSIAQIGAIEKARKLAKEIIHTDRRDITEDYQNGLTLTQIAEKYIPNSCLLSTRVSRAAVNIVLKEFLSREEKKQLGEEHLRESGKRKSQRLSEEKRGIYGMSKEERKKHGFRYYPTSLGKLTYEQRVAAGRVGAASLMRDKKGIFGLTKEQRIENARIGGEAGGRKGGRAAALKKGYCLWTNEENETLWALAHQNEYTHQRALYKGMPDYAKIVSTLNEMYHNRQEVRNIKNVRAQLQHIRVERGELWRDSKI